MRIKKLKIESLRGIVHTEIVPDRENVVVYGPNGSGKSAVVDAIDFLLTGQISRLIGEGTSGITLIKHGKHVTTEDLSDCYVEADVTIDGMSDVINVKRYISSPSNLIVDEAVRSEVEEVMHVAEKHQFLLTRREILRFITAENSSRSSQIQKLLKLDEVGETRKQLVSVVGRAKNEKMENEKLLQSMQTQLAVTVGVQHDLSDTECLLKVNELRTTLGAEPLTDCDPSLFLSNIEDTKNPVKLAIKKELKQQEVLRLLDIIVLRLNEKAVSDLMIKIKAFGDAVGILQAMNADLGQIRLLNLMQQGSDLLGKTEDDYSSDVCPLCLSEMESSKLRSNLVDRINRVSDLEKVCTSIVQSRDLMIKVITELGVTVNALTDSLNTKNFTDEISVLDELSILIKEYTMSIDKEVIDILKLGSPTAPAIKILGRIRLIDLDELRRKVIEKVPEGTTREESISMLTRIQSKSKEIVDQRIILSLSDCYYMRASILKTSFEDATKEVFDELFNSIKERFVQLYKKLHGEDEGKFEAEIIQEGAGVNMSVDFYGLGQNPPHALHSEGHQDSMGLCLFLALNEKVCEGKIELVVLDDVVMSVDAQHRRSLCKLLKDEFPNSQFVITTHDTTWATQMKSSGLVKRQNMVKFYDWNVESGPKYGAVENDWDLVKSELVRDEVPSASARMRRMLEEYFLNLCVDLRASVPCKIEKDWTLGETLPAAVGAFKNCLRVAKNSAQRAGNNVLHEEIGVKESEFQQIYERTCAEQWVVNRTTHYTHWATLVKEDFEPIVEAFEDLVSSLTCQSCKQACHLLCNTSNPSNPEMMQCECGKMCYRLV